MLEQIRSWLRREPPTEEEREARAEGKQIRDEIDTLRVHSISGPSINPRSDAENR